MGNGNEFQFCSGFGFLMVVVVGVVVSGGLVVFVWYKRNTYRERERKRCRLRIKKN